MFSKTDQHPFTFPPSLQLLVFLPILCCQPFCGQLLCGYLLCAGLVYTTSKELKSKSLRKQINSHRAQLLITRVILHNWVEIQVYKGKVVLTSREHEVIMPNNSFNLLMFNLLMFNLSTKVGRPLTREDKYCCVDF